MAEEKGVTDSLVTGELVTERIKDMGMSASKIPAHPPQELEEFNEWLVKAARERPWAQEPPNPSLHPPITPSVGPGPLGCRPKGRMRKEVGQLGSF